MEKNIRSELELAAYKLFFESIIPEYHDTSIEDGEFKPRTYLFLEDIIGHNFAVVKFIDHLSIESDEIKKTLDYYLENAPVGERRYLLAIGTIAKGIEVDDLNNLKTDVLVNTFASNSLSLMKIDTIIESKNDKKPLLVSGKIEDSELIFNKYYKLFNSTAKINLN